MSDAELRMLSELAARVPENGTIVEVGSLYGLSTWHMAKYSKPSVTIVCIDPWVREQWVVDLVERPQAAPPFCREVFHRLTKEFAHKIVAIQGYSPFDVSGWQIPIDMYFEDAVHTNPVLKKNIDFWSDRVKVGGTVCGHDYGSQFPDVKTEVDSLTKKLESTLGVEGTLWYLTK